MPNHVYNEVNMKNITKKDYFTEYTDEFTGNKVRQFDFNKLIPMPESLEMIEGSISDYAMEEALLYLIDRYINSMSGSFFLSNNIGSKKIYKIQKLFSAVKTEHDKKLSNYLSINDPDDTIHSVEDLRKLGIQYLSNIVNYGYPTWYNWCTNNWGTKWNSYDNAEYDDDTISFLTAWSIPEQIYIELSKQNPYDEITVRWDDEGGFTGTNIYLDGECIYEDSHQSQYEEDDEYDLHWPYLPYERLDDHPRRRLFSRCNPNDYSRKRLFSKCDPNDALLLG